MKAVAAAGALVALVALARPARAQTPDAGPSDEPAPPDTEVIDASKLSKLPKQIKFVTPDYPLEAKEKHIEAEVVLLLDIDETGKVASVGLSQPADPPGMGFDESAMVAGGQLEFDPAEVDGKPIAVQITFRFKFVLPKEEPVEPPPVEAAPPPAPSTAPAPPPPGVVNFAGKLVERGTRIPMSGVLVTVFRDDTGEPLGFEANTDSAGRFAFYDLTPGPWKVLVEAPGYYPFRTTEDIAEGERVDATYHVERGSYNPYDVTVTAERPRKEVSRTVLSAEELDDVPGVDGDPLTVVQNFAGVARADGAGVFVVRGSAPEDTRIFVDGIGVPLIYHFGALKSVLPIGVLDSIEFYPGNFSPAYGRATGGIIDVRIKELAPTKVGGYADVSILDSGVYLEAPLGDKGGIAVAARRSYIDLVLKAVIPDDAGVSLRTAPRYYDFQLLASYRPAPAHDLRLFAFGSDDRLALLFENPADLDPMLEGNQLDSRMTFYRGLATYRYVPSKRFENSLRLSAGNDVFDSTIGQLAFYLDLTTAQLRDVARYSWSDHWSISVGTDTTLSIADLFVRLPLPPKEGEPQTDFDITELLTSRAEGDMLWSPAVFAEAELSPVRDLLILPGIRLDYFQSTDQALIQPRLTARWNVAREVTLKAGAGLFTQEPTFDEFDEVFGNPDLDAEKALHYSVGAEYRPNSWLTLDATGFYKDMWDLVSPTDALVMDENGQQRPLIYDNEGTGQVYGLELQARHAFAHNVSGWLAYTLSRAERRDSGQTEDRLFDFDQTHILTLVGSALLPRNWQIGGRLRVVSGNPDTPVVGSVYNASTDRYDPIFGEVNSDRDDVFHQLDLRAEKRWIRENWILSAYLDIQNVYNRSNPIGVEYNFDFSQSQAQTSIPILTIIGVRGEF